MCVGFGYCGWCVDCLCCGWNDLAFFVCLVVRVVVGFCISVCWLVVVYLVCVVDSVCCNRGVWFGCCVGLFLGWWEFCVCVGIFVRVVVDSGFWLGRCIYWFGCSGFWWYCCWFLGCWLWENFDGWSVLVFRLWLDWLCWSWGWWCWFWWFLKGLVGGWDVWLDCVGSGFLCGLVCEYWDWFFVIFVGCCLCLVWLCLL